MGMNDGGLTPREHAEMRDLVLAGTQRIRPAGSHRAQLTAAAVALVLVGAVTGGAITTATLMGTQQDAGPVSSPAPTPTPTPSVTPTPSPTPTGTPTPTPAPPTRAQAVSAFGGECANSLSVDEVTAAVGVEMVLHEPAWRSGAEGRMGGLVCTWTDPTGYKTHTVYLISYPASLVPADIQDAPALCGGEEYGCAISGAAGESWLYLSVSPTAGETASRGLWELAASRAAEFPPPLSESPAADWWPTTSCEQLADGVDLLGATGWRWIRYNAPEFDDTGTVWGLPNRVGGVSQCQFTGSPDDASYVDVSLRVIPGAGGYFPQIAASEGATSVEVAGALAAAEVLDDDLWEGHYATTVATDGVNLVIVGVNSFEDRAVGSSIAAAVLAVM